MNQKCLHCEALAKQCQNCNANFEISEQERTFLAETNLPAPTWCPDCRLLRKLLWRNERTLYKRKCDAPGHTETLISVYAANSPMKVYDSTYWWSDAWDPQEYGRAYDFSRNFFDQFRELLHNVPFVNLLVKNSIGSDYCNSVFDMKNCYLTFAAGWCENTHYSTNIDYAKDCLELASSIKNELCYDLLFGRECYRVTHGRFVNQCTESAFLYDCHGVSYCFGCVGLRNKSYCIWNTQYTKEEYKEKIKEYDFGSYQTLKKLQEKFEAFRLTKPYRYSRITNSVDATGDNIRNAKNVRNCYDVIGEAFEDSTNNTLTYGKPSKNIHSSYVVGESSERCYDAASIANANTVLFSKKIWTGHNIQYSLHCHNCTNMFGCIGIRNKSYCILNQEHTKEEYEKLIPQIIEHMNQVPYKDQKGREYRYGEFFPPELSPFAYNETTAQRFFPLREGEAHEKGYAWRESEMRKYQATIKAENIPSHIEETQDTIINEVVECADDGSCNHQCTIAFRIVPQELDLHRRLNVALPRLCPNCRFEKRTSERNPLKLWHRKCCCEKTSTYENTTTHIHGSTPCPNEFETSYAPERPELVYCDECYQAETI